MAKITVPDLKKEIKRISGDMAKETNALAKGLYIAMSNANVKKGMGTKPKPGSKKAAGSNWEQGGELTVTYKVRHHVYTVPVSEWIEKLKNKDATETYIDKSGKQRRRKVSKYNVIRLKSQHEPGRFFERDVWRKGSKGALPYSWGAKGQKNLASYYMRKQWRYTAKQLAAEVRISPAVFRGEDNNERVLKLIDEGGIGKGSRTLKGFEIIFTSRQKGRQNIGIKKVYYDTPKTVRLKGYNIKRKVLGRANRILKRLAPSKILPSQWRQIGSGNYGK